mmetsp:Transcript_12379/g.16236  ORF Transcript_12379/g.16236 Transcript_12379/m.16236 type:complete len:365 (+) Transcript_12379:343-1437(+)|eukprot:CAMPEP_0198143738 /NCGR_PEP_ID=MMETSP1443-20131203/10273_1 /TAXON_ID=186043 /ORGANISM="Entomoneis sp., Strain CCMP2396" /LENGTH=364 /DNA_ID=CAMNT_0043807023 /DNA_START=252 /DNA_END=1346 /DNA_ORIENTATION=+
MGRRWKKQSHENDPIANFRAMDDAEDKHRNNNTTSSSSEAAGRTTKASTTKDDSFRDEPYSSDGEEDDEEEVYIVKQEYAYLSYGFSFVQTVIMGLLIWQCGIAPLRINPMLGPYPDALSEWGGKNAVLILDEDDNEWWRLLTPILLHAGLLHLFANVSVQLEAGAFFEKEWGSARWLIIYLGSAVASSVLSVIVMPQSVSVGSSGAVMGLFGAKLAELLLKWCHKADTKEARISAKVRKEQCCMVTCSVVTVMAFSFIPYVDWAAHLGGLLGGLVIGCVIFALELEFMSCKFLWFALGLATTIAMYAAAIWYMYNGDIEVVEELRDVCGYYQQQFEDYECRCMKEEYANNNGEDNGDRMLFLY